MAEQRCPYCLNPTVQADCPHCGRAAQQAAEEARSMDAVQPGFLLLARYWLGAVLHRNGEGIVYAAYDLQRQSRVEVREFFPQGLCSRGESGTVQVPEEQLLAFKSLMFDFTDIYKAAAEHGGKGLVQVQEIFLDNGTAYAVTDFCDLPTLEQYVQEVGSLSVMECRKILLQLCSALTPIHQLGLLHGGIAPANIYIDDMSQIRLSGFSTLSLRTRGSGIPEELYPGFSAPEQYEANCWQGSFTDVYGIGATAYFLLTARVPPSAVQRQEKDRLLPLAELVRAIPEPVVQAVQHALYLESGRRIQSIEEFSSTLLRTPQGNTAVFSIKANETLILDSKTRILRSVPQEEQTVVLPQQERVSAPKSIPKKSRKGWVALLFAAAAAGFIGLAVLLSGRIQTGQEQWEKVPLPEPRYVPSLEGRHIDTILSNEQWEQEFAFSVRYAYSETVPEGVVIDQGPDSGVKMLHRGTVILTVSKGSQKVPMPGLVGSHRDFALRTLTEMDIRYIVQETPEYPEGIVGKTSVVEGQLVDKETDTVYVYVGMHQVLDEPASQSGREDTQE